MAKPRGVIDGLVRSLATFSAVSVVAHVAAGAGEVLGSLLTGDLKAAKDAAHRTLTAGADHPRKSIPQKVAAVIDVFTSGIATPIVDKDPEGIVRTAGTALATAEALRRAGPSLNAPAVTVAPEIASAWGARSVVGLLGRAAPIVAITEAVSLNVEKVVQAGKDVAEGKVLRGMLRLQEVTPHGTAIKEVIGAIDEAYLLPVVRRSLPTSIEQRYDAVRGVLTGTRPDPLYKSYEEVRDRLTATPPTPVDRREAAQGPAARNVPPAEARQPPLSLSIH